MRTLAMGMAILAATAGTATATVKTQVVEYQQGDTNLEGYLAWDDAATGQRPGVLVGGHEGVLRRNLRRSAP